MLNRRGFLGGILAAAVAPAIVRPGILMPIKPALSSEMPTGFRFGSATIDASGPVEMWFSGTDAYGQPVEEYMSMNCGGGAQTKKAFFRISRIEVTSWDHASVFIRDGLGNMQIPDKIFQKRMSYFTEAEKVEQRKLGWIEPSWDGNGERHALANIVPNKDNHLVSIISPK